MPRIFVGTMLLLYTVLGCGGPKPPAIAGGKTTAQWIKALGDQEVAVRTEAIKKLGNIGSKDREALPAIMIALADAAPAVRREAIYAVVRNWPASREGLLVLKEMQENDGDPDIRKIAEEAHGNLIAKK